MRFAFACAAAVVAAAMFSAGAAAAAAAAVAPAPGGDAARGKAAFARTCYSCHGYEGQGGSTGPRLAPPQPYPAFSAFTRTTTGEMPPFTEKILPEQDLRDIHAYLVSIPRGPDPRTISILQ